MDARPKRKKTKFQKELFKLSAETYCQHHDNKGSIYWRANASENFIIISVFKYLHANFAILLETTELEVDNGLLLRAFSRGKSRSCFRMVG